MEVYLKKTKIIKLSNGFTFLGFKYYITNTGKVLMFVDGDTIKRFKKHIRNLVQACIDGKITKQKCDECVKSILAYTSKGNSYYLNQRIVKYYEEYRRKNHV